MLKFFKKSYVTVRITLYEFIQNHHFIKQLCFLMRSGWKCQHNIMTIRNYFHLIHNLICIFCTIFLHPSDGYVQGYGQRFFSLFSKNVMFPYKSHYTNSYVTDRTKHIVRIYTKSPPHKIVTFSHQFGLEIPTQSRQFVTILHVIRNLICTFSYDLLTPQ